MVIGSAKQGYITRIDLQTFKAKDVLLDDQPADDDYAVSAISDDGHYLVVDVQGKLLRMYPVDICFTAYGVGGAPSNGCVSYRDLGSQLNYFLESSQLTIYGGVPKFINDGLLSFYTGNNTNGHGDDYEYYFRAPHTSQTGYIALGDSYASGEGEGNDTFYPATDIHGVNMCHLSKISYPFLIGKDLKLDSTHSVACSGAKTTNIANGSGLDPQLKLANRDNQYYQQGFDYTKTWTPGYTAQLNYIQTYKPNIVTISAGGNDIGFSNILERCLDIGTCYSTYEDRVELVQLINNQFDKLVNLYKTIKQTTVPDARIYVIGYPLILKTDGDCDFNVRLNLQERVFAEELEEYLDATIESAAKKAGVFYVDDEAVFDGHRLCEADTPHDSAVNGITIGHDSKILGVRILSNGSFHPTQLGHRLLAKWIEQYTNSFNAPMPRTDATITGPPNLWATALEDMPKSGRPIQRVNYDNNLSNDIVYDGVDPITNPNPASLSDLQPYSAVHFWLHSQPLDLGTFHADADGSLSVNLHIPKSESNDFHTLYADVTLANGQSERLSKTVYVADSPNDFDGDGVPNSQEPCLIFEAPADQIHGTDYDCEAATESSNSPNKKPAINETRSTQTEAQATSPTKSKLQANAVDQTRSVDDSPIELITAHKSPEASNKKVSRSLNNKSNATNIIFWLGIGLLIVLTFLARIRYAKR